MKNKLEKEDRINTWRSVRIPNRFDKYFGRTKVRFLTFTWIKRFFDRSKQIIESLKKGKE